MDFLTHALSGAAMAYAVPNSMRSRFLPFYAAVISIIPDGDMLFTDTPVAFLIWHRGPTHSVLGGLLMSLILAFFLRRFLGRNTSTQLGLRNPATEYQWSFLGAWGFVMLLIMLHIWLDVANNYGTQIFWPIMDIRAYMDSVFIIDFLLLVPLIFFLVKSRNNRVVMVLLGLWVVIYPLLNMSVRMATESYLTKIYMQHDDLREKVRELHVLPDAFTPFRWNVVLETDDGWLKGGYSLFGTPFETLIEYKKPDPALWQKLGDVSEMFHAYDLFVRFPVQHPVRISDDGSGGQDICFSDIRFTSSIPFIQRFISEYMSDGEILFSFTARVDAKGDIVGVRLLLPKGSGGDSGWQTPEQALY